MSFIFFFSSLSSNLSFQRTTLALSTVTFVLIFYFISCITFIIWFYLLWLYFVLLNPQPLSTGGSDHKYQVLPFGLRVLYSLVSSSVPSNRCFQMFKVFSFSNGPWREHWYKLSNPLLPKGDVPNYIFLTFLDNESSYMFILKTVAVTE